MEFRKPTEEELNTVALMMEAGALIAELRAMGLQRKLTRLHLDMQNAERGNNKEEEIERLSTEHLRMTKEMRLLTTPAGRQQFAMGMVEEYLEEQGLLDLV